MEMDDQEDGKKKVEFKGPVEDRSCTDIPCCILFVAYIVGMIVVGIIAFKEGDPDRLLLPQDSQGNICGKDNFADKKYLLFFDISACATKNGDFLKFVSVPSCPTPQVCISECPKKNELGTSRAASDMVCKEGTEKVTEDKVNKAKMVSNGKCAPYYLVSQPVLYRCIPTLADNLLANTSVITNAAGSNMTKAAIEAGLEGLKILLNAQNFGMSIFEDMKAVWYWLLIGMVLILVLAFVYILITRWITGPLIFFTIIAVLGLIVYGMYFCYSKYKFLKDSGTSQDFELKFTFDLDSYTKSKETWLGLGILLTILLVILLLIVLVLCKRIRIAISLIKEASKAVSAIKTALFFPLIPWLLQLVLFAWFIAVAVYLVSNGTAQYKVIDVPENDQYGLTNQSDCDPKTFENKHPNTSASCVLAGYQENVHLFRMQVFHFFGWLWIMNFIIALGQCVLAGGFAQWYFTYQKEDVPTFPILVSFWRTLRYHTGSLAFGAAIIAIVQFIRAVLEYIDHKLKEANQDFKIVKFILCCCKCCFWCLEKCLKFLNKNAYIIIAIKGTNFCSSAKEAFMLLLENVLRVMAVNSVTTFLLFLGKLLVVGIVGVCSFFWFDKLNSDDPDTLQYDVVPTIAMVIFSYAVAVLFFDVYDMAIDTIFLCFLVDLKINDGSAEKPYYMSDSLKEILHLQNRPPADSNDEGTK